MMPSLTLYFIIQPPQYLYMACHLAASIRTHFPPEVEVIGYCPAPYHDQMDKAPLEVLRRLRVRVERLETDGFFDPDYPHGNKLIALLAPKSTDYAAFLDSDMAFLRPCTVEELAAPGQVGMVPATSMRWADQSIWDDIYGVFDMPVPSERITMTRDQRLDVVPYFNAGLIVTDENFRTPDGKRFAEVLMETAQTIDRHSFIPHKRPYLDQMALPVATLRAGMTWNILHERYNYSIGGILRGKKLPHDADVTLLHYRSRDVLGDAGRKKDLDRMLNQQIGTRLVRWVFDVPEELALPLHYQPEEAASITAPDPSPIAVPDPSKAPMAVVTVADGDVAKLGRWRRYYGAVFGESSLYILNPGNDPDVAKAAEGANLIPVPEGISEAAILASVCSFASGLTLYFNWVACVAVDEFLVVDPLRAKDLGDYLSQLTARGRVPAVSMPLTLHLTALPDQGPLYVRLDEDHQKACITRGRIAFTDAGKACNVKGFAVDPHLCLIRFCDAKGAAASDDPVTAPETMDLPEVRKALAAAKVETDDGFWRVAATGQGRLYRLPARMRDVLLGIQAGKTAT